MKNNFASHKPCNKEINVTDIMAAKERNFNTFVASQKLYTFNCSTTNSMMSVVTKFSFDVGE